MAALQKTCETKAAAQLAFVKPNAGLFRQCFIACAKIFEGFQNESAIPTKKYKEESEE